MSADSNSGTRAQSGSDANMALLFVLGWTDSTCYGNYQLVRHRHQRQRRVVASASSRHFLDFF